MRQLLIPLLITTAIASSVVLISGDSAQAETIGIDAGENWYCSVDFQTQPCVSDISVGDTVTWTMAMGVHTVTECEAGHVNCGNGWDSGILVQGETYSQTFNAAGNVSYYCSVHPDMTGVLNVQEETPTPTPLATATTAPDGGTTVPTSVPASAPSPGSVPKTGGPPEDSGGTPAQLLALVIGALLVTAGVSAVYSARRA